MYVYIYIYIYIYIIYIYRYYDISNPDLIEKEQSLNKIQLELSIGHHLA